jgi:hypothetical protein
MIRMSLLSLTVAATLTWAMSDRATAQLFDYPGGYSQTFDGVDKSARKRGAKAIDNNETITIHGQWDLHGMGMQGFGHGGGLRLGPSGPSVPTGRQLRTR